MMTIGTRRIGYIHFMRFCSTIGFYTSPYEWSFFVEWIRGGSCPDEILRSVGQEPGHLWIPGFLMIQWSTPWMKKETA